MKQQAHVRQDATVLDWISLTRTDDLRRHMGKPSFHVPSDENPAPGAAFPGDALGVNLVHP